MSDATLPENGWSPGHTLEVLEEMKSRDLDWSEGRHQGWVYHPGEDVVSAAASAMAMYYSTNPLLAGRAFPSLTKINDDLLAIASGLLHAPGRSGIVTNGGSESNLLGVWSALQLARGRREVANPNLIIPYSGHPSFNKAGMYFGIEVRRAPLATDFRVDVDAVRSMIDDATVLLVGSAPDYSHGAVDPIPELGQVALESELPLHVDACVGGFMLPFVERIGRNTPRWDFRTPGVRSISADIHKHGYGPKGVSVLITDAQDRVEQTCFEFADWPHGKYVTHTIGGTRSGGTLAGAWATFKVLGESGYKQLASDVMDISDRFVAGIEAIEELSILGDPPINKFAYSASELDAVAIADGLEARGWIVPRQGDPEAIGMHVASFHDTVVDRYLVDLEEAVVKVRSGELVRGRAAAAYN